MERWFVGLLAAVFLLLLLFAPMTGTWLQRMLMRPSFEGADEELSFLRFENASLKSELAEFSGAANLLRSASSGTIPVFVYSRYPFSFKDELIIAAGSSAGVKVGQAAAVHGSSGDARIPILLGVVTRVFSNHAAIRTVYDARFELPVRVGEKGVDALLAGGAAPRVTLIPKGESVIPGDAVYAASADLPYGFALGTVGEMLTGSDEVFREARLKLPYDLGRVRAVLLFPSRVFAEDEESD